MTTTANIQVASVPSNKSNNNVWAVFVQGQEENKTFCRNAWTAMKFCFILKERTGLYIAQESITALSQEIARIKALRQTAEQKAQADAIQEKVEEFCEDHSVDVVLASSEEEKAQAKRKARARESKDNACIGSAERSRVSANAKARAKAKAEGKTSAPKRSRKPSAKKQEAEAA